MKNDYLKLVEEHNNYSGINLFEKVLVIAKRAKSLHSLDEPAKAALSHKPTYQAILESNEGNLLIKTTDQTEAVTEE